MRQQGVVSDLSRHPHPRARYRWRPFVGEWVLIILVAVFAAQRYTPLDSTLVLGGYESEWLTSFAYHAADGMRTQGRIPLWQPYLERGEPALESLFSATLNPFSLFPSLIFGAEIGVRYSIITHVVIAGLGGWGMGWVLGFARPARLLLGILMLAKGNMPAVAAMGFFQLATTQAYLPWVVAATLAIARFRQRRTPVVLLAVALTLLYLGGNIYYVLPALILVGGIGMAYAIQRVGRRSMRVDRGLIGRYALALALTVALSAVTLLPLVLQRGYFGGHPNEALDAIYETPLTVMAQLFTPEPYYPWSVWGENYALYTVPVWFVVILFIALPPFIRRWNRPALPSLSGCLLIVALVGGGFFLLWGTGTNPLITWAYTHLPLIAQWRFVPRMLTLVSLFLAVIVAMRFDGLWRALILEPRPPTRRWLRQIGGGILIVLATVAAADLMRNFSGGFPIRTVNALVDEVMRSIRQEHGKRQITVIGRDYYHFKPYLDYHIRYTDIIAEAEYLPVASTLYPESLRFTYAEYAFAADNAVRQLWDERGYRLIWLNAERTISVLQYDEALPYAFAAPRAFLENYTPLPEVLPSNQTRGLKASQVIPLPNYVHLTDHVVLAVQPLVDEPLVVTLQELAYPGWAVTVDGQPAPLESVGGLIGVTLPEGTVPCQIIFRYDPPLFKIGALITITTVVLMVVWLMRADVRFYPKRGA